jgi:sugar lactone lactonase YvrE
VAVPATSIKLASPAHFAFDARGNLFLAECGTPLITKIDTFGLLTVYPSLFQGAASGKGEPALSDLMWCAAGLALDGTGNLYVADVHGNRIRRIEPNGIFSTVAGTGLVEEGGFRGDGGAATAALLHWPTDIALDSGGNLYIADSANNRIRMVDARGIITTVAGTGQPGFSGDGGPAASAQLNLASMVEDSHASIALDAQGNLYISDSYNARIRMIDRHGIITTFAGSGEPAYSGDGGPATAAAIGRPTGLAFDAEGNLYVATASTRFTFDSRIRKIDKQGMITTVVGTGEPSFSGDGGPALAATIRDPWGIAFDKAGNLYIADTGNNRVRKVDRSDTITTVAGGRP